MLGINVDLRWKHNNRRIKRRGRNWNPRQQAGVMLLNACEYLASGRGQCSLGVIFVMCEDDYDACGILTELIKELAEEERRSREQKQAG